MFRPQSLFLPVKHETTCFSAIVMIMLTCETATSVTARVCTSRMGMFQTGWYMPVVVSHKCVSGNPMIEAEVRGQR